MRVVTKDVNQIIARVIRHRWAIILIVVHTVLLIWSSLRNGFGWTEVGLLPAGILDWQYNGFDVFRVNPPLVRMWATWPLALSGVEIPFIGTSTDPRDRAEWIVGKAMIDQYGTQTYGWLAVARLMCLPFAWLGMIVAYCWSSQLFGRAAGIGALILWTFSPMMIGYGSLISGDAQAATMGLVTLYLFRNWLYKPGYREAYLYGLATGFAILTKSSWLVLFGLLPVIWFIVRFIEAFRTPPFTLSFQTGWRVWLTLWKNLFHDLPQCILAAIIALFLINAFYEFRGSFRRLDSYEFISKALAGSDDWQSEQWSNNRFRGTVIGLLPVPFPEDFLVGVDLQKWDFDRLRWSYLRGQWQDHGWWYYYLYAAGIKVPVGSWILIAIAFFGALRVRSMRAPFNDELLLCVPIIAILFAASSETGLNRHFRYVLPVFPFVIIFISRAFLLLREPYSTHSRFCATSIVHYLLLISTTWLVVSSLFVFPHSASYFNELIGGPMNGWKHLNASNLTWGQDVRYVERWTRNNPEKRPLLIRHYVRLLDLDRMGVQMLGTIPSLPIRKFSDLRIEGRFLPGWYVIDQETMLRDDGDYSFMRELANEKHEKIGYGFIAVFITEATAIDLEERLATYQLP